MERTDRAASVEEIKPLKIPVYENLDTAFNARISQQVTPLIAQQQKQKQASIHTRNLERAYQQQFHHILYSKMRQNNMQVKGMQTNNVAVNSSNPNISTRGVFAQDLQYYSNNSQNLSYRTKGPLMNMRIQTAFEQSRNGKAAMSQITLNKNLNQLGSRQTIRNDIQFEGLGLNKGEYSSQRQNNQQTQSSFFGKRDRINQNPVVNQGGFYHNRRSNSQMDPWFQTSKPKHSLNNSAY